MSDDALELTAYFGERARVGGRLVSDVLLDLYGAHAIAVSLLARGSEGFGAKHGLRTSRLLTLSEDLPLIALAVDSRERIEALVPEVSALIRSGLLTLERARLVGAGDYGGRAATARQVGGDAGALAPRGSVGDTHEVAEPSGGDAKLTVYLGRGERPGRGSSYVAVCELLRRHGVAGATVVAGVDGTVRGERRRGRLFGRNVGVPAMVVAVGERAAIDAALAQLDAPIATLERVRICRRDGVELAPAHAGLAGSASVTPGVPAASGSAAALGAHVRSGSAARWQKLTVYSSAHALHDGSAVHVALVRRLREAGLAGATALAGVWGFHGDHAPHGDRLLQLRRRVPMLTTVVDTPERIATASAIAFELTGERGLVTSELVPAFTALVDGEPTGRLLLPPAG